MRGWLRLHVSNICNFNCPHCHVFRESENNLPAKIMTAQIMDLALKNYGEVLEQHEMDELTISIYGGEALLARRQLYPFMKSVGDSYNAKKIRWIINSNGSLLSADDVKFFATFKDIEFHLGLDGPTHVQRLTRPGKDNSDTFASAMAALELLRGTGIKTQINSYLTPQNMEHLTELVHVAKDHGVASIYMDVLHSKREPVSEEAIERYKEFFVYAGAHGVRVNGPWSSVNFDLKSPNHIESKILGCEVLIDGTFYATVFPLDKSRRRPLAEMARFFAPPGLAQLRDEVTGYFGRTCAGCPVEKQCGGGAIAQYHYHVAEEKGHHSACDFYREMLRLFQLPFSVYSYGRAEIHSQFTEGESAKFARHFDRQIRELERRLGPLRGKVKALLFKDHRDFRLFSGSYRLPQWIRGIVNGKAYFQYGCETPTELRHEIAHFFVAQAQRRELPGWFVEGICEYLSKGEAEGADEATNLDFSLLSDVRGAEVLAIDDRPVANSAFYRQSHAFVTYLIRRRGLARVLRLVRHQQNDFDRAAQRDLGSDVATLQAQWRSEMTTTGSSISAQ